MERVIIWHFGTTYVARFVNVLPWIMDDKEIENIVYRFWLLKGDYSSEIWPLFEENSKRNYISLMM